MTYDEKILNYKMTEQDKELAEIAQVIVGAYNGSYKPHLIPKEREIAPPYYRWKHTSEGYSLISSETQDFEHPQILTTDENMSDFIEHVFLILAGNPSVKWDDICKSDAVNRTLAKYNSKEIMMLDEKQLKKDIDNVLAIYNRLNGTHVNFAIQEIEGGFPGGSMGHCYMLISINEQQCVGNSVNSSHNNQYIFNKAIEYLSEITKDKEKLI